MNTFQIDIHEQLRMAEDLARQAHEGQTRRDRSTPYIRHVEDVARRSGSSKEEKTVGWLHDVVEDSFITLEYLRNLGFSEEIVNAVDSVTKREGESYHNYIMRCRKNIIGRQVKFHDMMSNLCDNPTKRQILKYSRALITLIG